MTIRKLHATVAVVALVCIGSAAWWFQNKAPAAGGMQAGSEAAAAKAGTGAPAGGPGRPGGPGQGAAGGGSSDVSAGGGGPRGPGGGGPGGGGQGGPAPVEVAKAVVMRLEDDAQAVGSLRARQGVMMRPEVSGRIAQLPFGDGQRVRKGQLLVQLDDTLQQAQVKQAEAQAGIAQTNLKRSRELLAQNFVSQSAVDQNAAALEVAQAQVALANAQLARMKVVAPFDGQLGIRLVNLGDYVKDGADLVNIEDTGMLWADFRLPENYIPRLKLHQPVEVTVEAMPKSRFTARVDAVDAQLDANGRSLLVRARMENTGGMLKSGMFVRTRVVFAVREDAVVVPEEALVPLGDKQFLFKVVDGKDGAKVAQRTEAAIGVRVPGKVEIIKGLAAGDLVVTAGHQRLLRGDNLAVRPVELDKLGQRGAGRGPQGGGGGPNGPAASGAKPQGQSGQAPGQAGSASTLQAPAAASAPARKGNPA